MDITFVCDSYSEDPFDIRLQVHRAGTIVEL